MIYAVGESTCHMHPEVRRYYDEDFDKVNSQGLSGAATRFFHRALETALSPNMFLPNVLELGTAHGQHLQFVRHGFDHYVLTDIEDHSIDLQRVTESVQTGNGLRQVSFQIADAMSLPFGDSAVDRTVHTCLLHHLIDPELALREMRRVLRNGGVASVYLPCDPGLLYSMTQRSTTGRKIRRALRDGGYSISPAYLRAREHPNHFTALHALVLEVFKDDLVYHRGFPFPWATANANYFSVFQIQIMK